MGRKRTVVVEPPPKDEAADEGFDEAPEFNFDDTPETHEKNDEVFASY